MFILDISYIIKKMFLVTKILIVVVLNRISIPYMITKQHVYSNHVSVIIISI